MSETGIRGIDLFKIAGESISGWIPSWKMGGQKPTRQPFCSLMEERLLMYLEYDTCSRPGLHILALIGCG